MEHLLELYARPYDPRYPVVCFDERPCFLIGEVMEPLPGKVGQVAKEHYAYADSHNFGRHSHQTSAANHT